MARSPTIDRGEGIGIPISVSELLTNGGSATTLAECPDDDAMSTVEWALPCEGLVRSPLCRLGIDNAMRRSPKIHFDVGACDGPGFSPVAQVALPSVRHAGAISAPTRAARPFAARSFAAPCTTSSHPLQTCEHAMIRCCARARSSPAVAHATYLSAGEVVVRRGGVAPHMSPKASTLVVPPRGRTRGLANSESGEGDRGTEALVRTALRTSVGELAWAPEASCCWQR